MKEETKKDIVKSLKKWAGALAPALTYLTLAGLVLGGGGIAAVSSLGLLLGDSLCGYPLVAGTLLAGLGTVGFVFRLERSFLGQG